MDSKIEKLKKLTDKLISLEVIRKNNIEKLKKIYNDLKIDEKVKNFDEIFLFKAMNLSGISLNENEFAKIQEGKYVQIIGIKKEDKKLKNINLRYFGRAEKIEKEQLEKIVEFVIRWRLEKSFLQVEHYKNFLKKLEEKNV
ncbi:hypothetical protein [Nitrosophilus kaiyonis]|uniref:hypothetical protein n=1 Tax=Nitrosophilus kaiyonis TaxID=2930200 RepID=UPI00248FB5D0|nr:hypothetical protein [Nitrosophilus kaiyonis]